MTRALVWLFLSALATACVSAPIPPSSAPGPSQLSSDFASRAVNLSLKCIEIEAPHWNEGQGGRAHAERQRHPAFYGCFDWHSAVHGHWAMLRAVDQIPGLPEKAAVVEALSRHLSRENIAGELASIDKITHAEMPYGFAWGLRLGEELRLSKLPEAAGWRKAYSPLEQKLVEEIRGYLTRLTQPNRIGMHGNTAFAMIHAWDYAATTGDSAFQAFLEKRARNFFLADQNCSLSSEPGPTDFISPCFVEADLMRRVLAKSEFGPWYDRFLPNVSSGELRPVPPSNPKDYYQVHLVGLMYEKSSAMRGVAEQLSPEDPRRKLLLSAVAAQVQAAGKLMFDSGYGGTHWLASFAIYYYTGVGR